MCDRIPLSATTRSPHGMDSQYKPNSLLGIPIEVFETILEFLEWDFPLYAEPIATKRHLYSLSSTCSSLQYLKHRWDSLTIQINCGLTPLYRLSSRKQSTLFNRQYEFVVTNHNVFAFCKLLVKGDLVEWLRGVKKVKIVEHTPYTSGNCCSTLVIPKGVSFDNVKQSHAFSWLLTSKLTPEVLPGLREIDIERHEAVMGLGLGIVSETATCGSQSMHSSSQCLSSLYCSALELFVRRHGYLGQGNINIQFSSISAFQISDTELSNRVTSLKLSSSAFGMLRERQAHQSIVMLPKSLKRLDIEIQQVEAKELASVLHGSKIVNLSIAVYFLYNIKSVNWVPPTVTRLAIDDRSKSPVPRLQNELVTCRSVRELEIHAGSGYNLVGMSFPNLEKLSLKDSFQYRTSTSDDALKQILRSRVAGKHWGILNFSPDIKTVDYQFCIELFSELLPPNVLKSVEKLQCPWYSCPGSEMDKSQAVQACTNLSVLETEHRFEYRDEDYMTYLAGLVSCVPDDCNVVVRSRNGSKLPFRRYLHKDGTVDKKDFVRRVRLEQKRRRRSTSINNGIVTSPVMVSMVHKGIEAGTG